MMPGFSHRTLSIYVTITKNVYYISKKHHKNRAVSLVLTNITQQKIMQAFTSNFETLRIYRFSTSHIDVNTSYFGHRTHYEIIIW